MRLSLQEFDAVTALINVVKLLRSVFFIILFNCILYIKCIIMYKLWAMICFALTWHGLVGVAPCWLGDGFHHVFDHVSPVPVSNLNFVFLTTLCLFGKSTYVLPQSRINWKMNFLTNLILKILLKAAQWDCKYFFYESYTFSTNTFQPFCGVNMVWEDGSNKFRGFKP